MAPSVFSSIKITARGSLIVNPFASFSGVNSDITKDEIGDTVVETANGVGFLHPITIAKMQRNKHPNLISFFIPKQCFDSKLLYFKIFDLAIPIFNSRIYH